MIINFRQTELSFQAAVKGKVSSQKPELRAAPPIWRYDFLSLRELSTDISVLISKASAQTKGGVCLDIGSNTGPYSSYLREAGYRIESMDVTPGDNDYVGFIESIPLEDSKYDAILCTQVLEHSDKPWQGISEIARILKPGGMAIISAPHVWFFHPHPHDNWRFTQQGLCRLCSEAGLEVVELRGQLGAVANLFQIINFLAYGLFGKIGGPFYAALNLVGMLGDKLLPNDLFCGNFACLARKV